jgi:histidinol phosphatase-like enzyme
LGWVCSESHEVPGRILLHDGSNGKNYSLAYVALDAGFAVLVVTNQGGTRAGAAAEHTANRLFQFYLTGQ